MIALLSMAAGLVLAPAADTIRARVLAAFGEESATPVSFGKVSGFAFDARGRLYISDFQDAQVVVLGSDGRVLGRIGRRGDGPGEFRAPTGPVVGPDGALYVRNLVAVARFTADPATGLLSRFDRALEGPGMAPWTSFRATHFDREGRYYFPLEWMEGTTKRSVRSFVRYDARGRLVDTLPVPGYPSDPALTASVMTSPRGGRMVPGLNAAPFEPRAAWALTPEGTVLSGDGLDPVLRETDHAGRTLRTIAVGGAGRRAPPRERAESLAALKRRIDSLPVPLEQVTGTSQAVRDQRLPEVLPTYTALIVADSILWVRRWASSGRTLFDRVRLDGRPLDTVLLPVECAADPLPVIRGAQLACLTIDRETGSESVALLALPR